MSNDSENTLKRSSEARLVYIRRRWEDEKKNNEGVENSGVTLVVWSKPGYEVEAERIIREHIDKAESGIEESK